MLQGFAKYLDMRPKCERRFERLRVARDRNFLCSFRDGPTCRWSDGLGGEGGPDVL